MTEEEEELMEEADVELLSVEIIEDDVTSATLEQEELSTDNMGMEAVDDIADREKVALVEQTVAFDLELEGETHRDELESYTLTATHDGEWLILDDVSEPFGL